MPSEREASGWGEYDSPPPGSRLSALQKPTFRVGVLVMRTAAEGRLCLPLQGEVGVAGTARSTLTPRL